MTDLYNQKENTRRFREALLKDLEIAERERDLAEQSVRRCRQKLRAFDLAFLPDQGQPIPTRGATAAVKRAIIVQEGREFTPAQIQKTIQEVFPRDAVLFPDVQSITRILAKLTLAGHLERIVQGAGLKSPIYRAVSDKHALPKRQDAEKPVQRTASPSRLLPE